MAVHHDEVLWRSCVEKAQVLFKTAVLPELLGKWYSRQSEDAVTTLPGPSAIVEQAPPSTGNDTVVYCYCQGPERDNMVACDNPSCQYMWFHFDCLKVTSPPKSKLWLCPDCRRLPQFARKRKTV